MQTKISSFGKAAFCCCFLVLSSSLGAQLLVDPYDTGNVNYLMFNSAEGSYDDDDRVITSGDAEAINGSSLPSPTLPAGLYFLGVDQGGESWYVSTNGGFFPISSNEYETSIQTNAGMWVVLNM